MKKIMRERNGKKEKERERVSKRMCKRGKKADTYRKVSK